MTRSLELRRGNSATYYVDTGPLAARLQTTLLLAARATGFPTAMVNIHDAESQHTISASGSEDGVCIPREESFCNAVLEIGGAVVSGHAAHDPRFSHLTSVREGKIASYAGVPLHGRESLIIGALCVVDTREHEISADGIAVLAQFAKVVEDQLDLIRVLKEQRRDGQVATTELADAIGQDQIVPWYQAVVDLSTGQLRGFEALARWEHPSGRVLHPKNFIPLAEDSDLVIDMDLSVMRRALRDLGRWLPADPELRMSVNISGRHFDRPDWISAIQAAAIDAGVPPSSVDIEVTETARLTEDQPLDVCVNELRDLGFKVWLDDFGTGWSSLEYLLRMPVNGIKLSQVVSVTLGTQIGNALIRAVTGLAAELGLHTTIEGIETPANAVLARKLGCDNAQGYLWSKAVPATTIDERAKHPSTFQGHLA
jgi:EAL domain-containing protein (putative c-di-GMP-specific phosphodiesterase class I)